MKYYTIQNGGILIADNKAALTRFYEDVYKLPNDYEEGKYIISGNRLVKNPNYDEEKVQQREDEFYSKFLATSKGNYRLTPKGYANAQQSIDTVNGNVNALGSLNEDIAEMVIFYPTPDFTKEEQCTEEWLVAHQYNIEPMTKEQWALYYLEFSRLYARNQYKPSEEQ